MTLAMSAPAVAITVSHPDRAVTPRMTLLWIPIGSYTQRTVLRCAHSAHRPQASGTPDFNRFIPGNFAVYSSSRYMSATCDVIARGAKLYVFPNCELQAGVRMACAPVTVLEQNSDVDVTGRAVMDALQIFRTHVPFPDDYEKAANEVLNQFDPQLRKGIGVAPKGTSAVHGRTSPSKDAQAV